MNLKELLEKRAALAAEIKALSEKVELTDEERARWAAANADYDRMTEQIDRLQRAERIGQTMAAPVEGAEPRGGLEEPGRPEPDDRSVEVDERAFRRITDLTRGLVRRHTSHYGRLNHFRGDVDGRTARERAYRFGVFFAAAAGFQWARRRARDIAIPLARDAELEARVQQEGVNTAGGFLVPNEFSADIIDLRDTYGVARKFFRVIPMVSETLTQPRRTGGLTAYYVGESVTGTQSTKGWDAVNLTAKKVMVLTKYSSELAEDAIINVADDLTGEIAYAFAIKEDEAAFKGDATTTYGGIRGAIGRLEDVNGVDEGGGTELAAGNALSEVTLADWNGLVARLPEYAEQRATENQPAFFTSKWVWGNSMQRLAAAAGGVTAEEIQGGQRRRMFLGYPVHIVSGCFPTSDANSQTIALYGNLYLAGTIGNRRGISIAISNAALNAFEKDELVIRGSMRHDINVHDVGTATAAGPVVNMLTAAS